MTNKEQIERALFSDTSRYNDIMKSPRHVSRAHLPMPQEDRAAQFAPFAALTGYHQLLAETAKRYKNKRYMTRGEREELTSQLCLLEKQIPIAVKMECFNGQSGYYQEYTGVLKKIDVQRHRLIFMNGDSVAIANLRKIRVQES